MVDTIKIRVGDPVKDISDPPQYAKDIFRRVFDEGLDLLQWNTPSQRMWNENVLPSSEACRSDNESTRITTDLEQYIDACDLANLSKDVLLSQLAAYHSISQNLPTKDLTTSALLINELDSAMKPYVMPREVAVHEQFHSNTHEQNIVTAESIAAENRLKEAQHFHPEQILEEVAKTLHGRGYEWFSDSARLRSTDSEYLGVLCPSFKEYGTAWDKPFVRGRLAYHQEFWHRPEDVRNNMISAIIARVGDPAPAIPEAEQHATDVFTEAIGKGPQHLKWSAESQRMWNENVLSAAASCKADRETTSRAADLQEYIDTYQIVKVSTTALHTQLLVFNSIAQNLPTPELAKAARLLPTLDEDLRDLLTPELLQYVMQFTEERLDSASREHATDLAKKIRKLENNFPSLNYILDSVSASITHRGHTWFGNMELLRDKENYTYLAALCPALLDHMTYLDEHQLASGPQAPVTPRRRALIKMDPEFVISECIKAILDVTGDPVRPISDAETYAMHRMTEAYGEEELDRLLWCMISQRLWSENVVPAVKAYRISIEEMKRSATLVAYVVGYEEQSSLADVLETQLSLFRTTAMERPTKELAAAKSLMPKLGPSTQEYITIYQLANWTNFLALDEDQKLRVAEGIAADNQRRESLLLRSRDEILREVANALAAADEGNVWFKDSYNLIQTDDEYLAQLCPTFGAHTLLLDNYSKAHTLMLRLELVAMFNRELLKNDVFEAIAGKLGHPLPQADVRDAEPYAKAVFSNAVGELALWHSLWSSRSQFLWNENVVPAAQRSIQEKDDTNRVETLGEYLEYRATFTEHHNMLMVQLYVFAEISQILPTNELAEAHRVIVRLVTEDQHYLMPAHLVDDPEFAEKDENERLDLAQTIVERFKQEERGMKRYDDILRDTSSVLVELGDDWFAETAKLTTSAGTAYLRKICPSFNKYMNQLQHYDSTEHKHKRYDIFRQMAPAQSIVQDLADAIVTAIHGIVPPITSGDEYAKRVFANMTDADALSLLFAVKKNKLTWDAEVVPLGNVVHQAKIQAHGNTALVQYVLDCQPLARAIQSLKTLLNSFHSNCQEYLDEAMEQAENEPSSFPQTLEEATRIIEANVVGGSDWKLVEKRKKIHAMLSVATSDTGSAKAPVDEELTKAIDRACDVDEAEVMEIRNRMATHKAQLEDARKRKDYDLLRSARDAIIVAAEEYRNIADETPDEFATRIIGTDLMKIPPFGGPGLYATSVFSDEVSMECLELLKLFPPYRKYWAFTVLPAAEKARRPYSKLRTSDNWDHVKQNLEGCRKNHKEFTQGAMQGFFKKAKDQLSREQLKFLRDNAEKCSNLKDEFGGQVDVADIPEHKKYLAEVERLEDLGHKIITVYEAGNQRYLPKELLEATSLSQLTVLRAKLNDIKNHVGDKSFSLQANQDDATVVTPLPSRPPAGKAPIETPKHFAFTPPKPRTHTELYGKESPVKGPILIDRIIVKKKITKGRRLSEHQPPQDTFIPRRPTSTSQVNTQGSREPSCSVASDELPGVANLGGRCRRPAGGRRLIETGQGPLDGRGAEDSEDAGTSLTDEELSQVLQSIVDLINKEQHAVRLFVFEHPENGDASVAYTLTDEGHLKCADDDERMERLRDVRDRYKTYFTDVFEKGMLLPGLHAKLKSKIKDLCFHTESDDGEKVEPDDMEVSGLSEQTRRAGMCSVKNVFNVL
eukprot:GHVQ01017916.1.p1 GENE.GHVQ01017916.1~~GHVQ01017916.1.p1  ORF type:complete len:1987 (-),score=233.72 GHVQ01017916.1:2726-7825(-)